MARCPDALYREAARVRGSVAAREAPHTLKSRSALRVFLRLPLLLLCKVGFNPFHMFQIIDDGAIDVPKGQRGEALLDLLSGGALFEMLHYKVNTHLRRSYSNRPVDPEFERRGRDSG